MNPQCYAIGMGEECMSDARHPHHRHGESMSDIIQAVTLDQLPCFDVDGDIVTGVRLMAAAPPELAVDYEAYSGGKALTYNLRGNWERILIPVDAPLSDDVLAQALASIASAVEDSRTRPHA